MFDAAHSLIDAVFSSPIILVWCCAFFDWCCVLIAYICRVWYYVFIACKSCPMLYILWCCVLIAYTCICCVWYFVFIVCKSCLMLYLPCLGVVSDTVYQSPISRVWCCIFFVWSCVFIAYMSCLMLFIHYLLVMFGAMYLLSSFKSVRCYLFYAVWCHVLFAFKSRFMFLCGLTFAGCHPSLHPVIVVFVFTLYKWI